VERRELIEEFKASGLAQTAFCREWYPGRAASCPDPMLVGYASLLQTDDLYPLKPDHQFV
jgi:hypothetical protein